MRVAILCAEFAPDMGYIMNLLPKYLARAGAEVHLLTLAIPPYFRARKTALFRAAQNPPAGTSSRSNGFQVHVLRCGSVSRFPYAEGLLRLLTELKPDIVYSILAIGALPLQAAIHSWLLKYKLYTGNHTSVEAFPMARNPPAWWTLPRLEAFATRWLPGRIVSLRTQKCYCRTAGCGEIAGRYFGVQRRKIEVVMLGVDTDYFFPIRSNEQRKKRGELRTALGFTAGELVCINTGRMLPHKDLELLVHAVRALRAEGLPFRCLFVGDGPERAKLSAAEGCVVLPHKPFGELGDYYRAADIGVWPAGESTSMFDASACGLPLVVSDGIDAHLDGNGFTFPRHARAALTDALRKLTDDSTRARVGARGAQITRERQGMDVIAALRLRDFSEVLGAVDAIAT